MIPSSYWNPLQKELATLISGKRAKEAIDLCISLHAQLHESTKEKSETFEDRLWQDLDYEICRIVTKKNTSIIWNIWHITRIEDLIAGIVIGQGSQVYNKEWAKRLGTKVTDTGNAMSHDEVAKLSAQIDIDALRAYRREVAKTTQKILRALKDEDLSRKVTASQMQRILQEGGVLEEPGSKWLLDFWGRKKISGLLTMPLTRHQVVHLNDSFAIKKRGR